MYIKFNGAQLSLASASVSNKLICISRGRDLNAGSQRPRRTTKSTTYFSCLTLGLIKAQGKATSPKPDRGDFKP
jgi:hypothetical protein